jgi:superfamily II DNA or RNA helicase
VAPRPMARVSDSVRLRPWQCAALEGYARHGQPDFLAVATPGAGKTTFALVAARLALAEEPATVVVITPTAHLKTQWAQAAVRLGLAPGSGLVGIERRPCGGHARRGDHLSPGGGQPARRTAARGRGIRCPRRGAPRRRGSARGAALQHALGVASRRLSLSGTPFRSDTLAIPFVRYHGDEAIPDFGTAMARRCAIVGSCGPSTSPWSAA